MSARQYLTQPISVRLDEMLRWYESKGKFLREPERPRRGGLSNGAAPGRRVRGLTTAVVSSTDGTFAIDNIVPIVGGDPTSGTTSGELTVVNSHDWDAPNNAVCRAELVQASASTDKWEAYQVNCSTST